MLVHQGGSFVKVAVPGQIKIESVRFQQARAIDVGGEEEVEGSALVDLREQLAGRRKTQLHVVTALALVLTSEDPHGLGEVGRHRDS